MPKSRSGDAEGTGRASTANTFICRECQAWRVGAEERTYGIAPVGPVEMREQWFQGLLADVRPNGGHGDRVLDE